jgi:hypothetical protein
MTTGMLFFGWQGGKIIWVAPSGGRDRRDDVSGDYSVAPFDAKSIEMFRLMADKAGRTTHFYPLSMLTYPICPPPEQIGGEVGERRTVKWSPAGLHFGEPVDLAAFLEGCACATTVSPNSHPRPRPRPHPHPHPRLAARLHPCSLAPLLPA